MIEIVAVLIMALITLWIFIGNFLVLYAFFSVRQIRSIDNMIIASLSATDFLLSISVAPLAIYNLIAPSEYRVYASCLLWLSSDVFLSTVSIWHLCAISFERFYCVVFPLKFMQNRKKRVKLLISLAWLSGVLITIPLIIMAIASPTTIYQVSNSTNGSYNDNYMKFNDMMTSNETITQNSCNYFNVYYSIISVIFSFWFPMIVMLFLTCFTMIVLNRSKYRLKPRVRSNVIKKKKKSVVATTIAEPQLYETTIQNFQTVDGENLIEDDDYDTFDNSVQTPQKVNFCINNENDKSFYMGFGLSRRFDSIEFIDENTDDYDCDMYTNCSPVKAHLSTTNQVELDEHTTKVEKKITAIVAVDLDTVTTKTTTDESIKENKNENGVIKLSDKIGNILKRVKKDNFSNENTLLSSVDTKSYSSNGLNTAKNNICNKNKNKSRAKTTDIQHNTMVISKSYSAKKSKKLFSHILKGFNKDNETETVIKTQNNNNSKIAHHSKVTQYVCKESEAQRRSLIVLIAFILGYTPLFTLITISWVSHFELNSNYFVISTWIGYLSSALNPSLYAWMNRNLKRAFYLIITCKLDRKHSRQNNILFK